MNRLEKERNRMNHFGIDMSVKNLRHIAKVDKDITFTPKHETYIDRLRSRNRRQHENI